MFFRIKGFFLFSPLHMFTVRVQFWVALCKVLQSYYCRQWRELLQVPLVELYGSSLAVAVIRMFLLTGVLILYPSMLYRRILHFTQGFDEIVGLRFLLCFSVGVFWVGDWVGGGLIIYDTWIELEMGSVRNYPKLAVLISNWRKWSVNILVLRR